MVNAVPLVSQDLLARPANVGLQALLAHLDLQDLLVYLDNPGLLARLASLLLLVNLCPSAFLIFPEILMCPSQDLYCPYDHPFSTLAQLSVLLLF